VLRPNGSDLSLKAAEPARLDFPVAVELINWEGITVSFVDDIADGSNGTCARNDADSAAVSLAEVLVLGAPMGSALSLYGCIAPFSPWEIYLEMEEPVMEQYSSVLLSDTEARIDDSVLKQKNSWLDWFDKLQLLKDFFKQKLQLS
jgi:hypothetical protein